MTPSFPRIFLLFLAVLPSLVTPAIGEPRHGIAMHGEPQLPTGFTHLPYVNPSAPQGGDLRLSVTGSFDNLNPFNIKGQRVGIMRQYVFESLMARNRAEPFALYGLLAESIDVTPDRRNVTFKLRKQARFSDGTPVTSADVLFSMQTLRDHGRPNHRTYYGKVTSITAPDPHTVKMTLDGSDRELVLILGLMPVLPMHFFKDRDFEATTLDPLLGSGPYRVAQVDAGKRLVLQRNRDYWANGLPISKGQWNFDRVVIDFYRDNQTAFEALKKNLVDVREELIPSRWATGYDFPAIKVGDFITETVPTGQPAAVPGLVFNTRRQIFADPLVREALLYAFDFEWANKNLFHGLFKRTQGFFDGTFLSSIGNPATEIEQQLLKTAGASIRPDILNGTFRTPVSDATGKDRANLRKALDLLRKAGWRLNSGRLMHGETGKPFQFTISTRTREQERIALHFQRSLRQIGITLDIRQVDSAQYQRRLQTYDFDMLQFTWENSLSPGNEQAFYWGSQGRKQPGTRNYMGANSPQIDAMIAELLKAESPEVFTSAARALDRLLISGFYMIPLYSQSGQWIARWAHIKRPQTSSLYGFLLATAWYEMQ